MAEPGMEPQVYSEAQAQLLCALAMTERRCADLLNVLSAGGAATVEPDGYGGGHLVTASAQAMRGLLAALSEDTQPIDLDRLRRAVGPNAERVDPRIDLPLEDQVEHVMKLVTAHRPDFRRSVPVDARDHDVAIHAALGKLIAALEQAQPS